jgi:hypothetical protein
MTGCLVTERMLLRRFTDADLDWLAALHGDPAVMRYIDDGKPVAAAVVAAETLPAILRDYVELPDGLGYFAATERLGGRPLGWFGLRPPSRWPTYIEHGDVVYEIAGQDWRPATSRAHAAGRPRYRSDGRLRG